MMLNLLLIFGGLNRWGGSACCTLASHMPSQVWNLEILREAQAGKEGRPGDHPSPPLHRHMCTHLCIQTHFPSLHFPLSLFPTNPIPEPSTPLPLYNFLSQDLLLWVSFNLHPPFLSPALPFLFSFLCPTFQRCLPPSPSSALQWVCIPVHTYTHFILYCIFTLPFPKLDMFRYINTYYCVMIGYSIQYTSILYRFIA